MKKETKSKTKIIKCTYGAEYEIQTKMESSKITICSNCHSF